MTTVFMGLFYLQT
jgi:hypothetical protein